MGWSAATGYRPKRSRTTLRSTAFAHPGSPPSPRTGSQYTEVALALDEYDPDRVGDLFHPKVSQLFRMALLASLWRKQGGFDFGHCVVACLAEDKDATAGVERLKDVHTMSRAIVRQVSHDNLSPRSSNCLATCDGRPSFGSATSSSSRRRDERR